MWRDRSWPNIRCRLIVAWSDWAKPLNISVTLTFTLLTWRIWWAPNIVSRWQIKFNSAFKGLIVLSHNLTGIRPHKAGHHILINHCSCRYSKPVFPEYVRNSATWAGLFHISDFQQITRTITVLARCAPHKTLCNCCFNSHFYLHIAY
jgi:hypothetical protein